MPRSRVLPLIVGILFACAAVAAGGAPKTVASLREAFRVPADAKVLFQSDDGAALTEAEFSKRLATAANVQLIKNPDKTIYTLALAKPAEFRRQTPITSLRGYSQLLLRRWDSPNPPDSEQVMNMLRRIDGHGRRLRRGHGQ